MLRFLLFKLHILNLNYFFRCYVIVGRIRWILCFQGFPFRCVACPSLWVLLLVFRKLCLLFEVLGTVLALEGLHSRMYSQMINEVALLREGFLALSTHEHRVESLSLAVDLLDFVVIAIVYLQQNRCRIHYTELLSHVLVLPFLFNHASAVWILFIFFLAFLEWWGPFWMQVGSV